MGRPKGSGNKTPEAKAFIQRMERMLAKGGQDGGLEAYGCRLLNHPGLQANETKFFAHKGEVQEERTVINWAARLQAAQTASQVWRFLMAHKHGMPKESIEYSGTVSFTETLQRIRERKRAQA